jgi:condensin complex subunit 1
MEDRIDFNLNDSLKYYLSDPATVPTPDAEPELYDCENETELLSSALIDGVIDPIVDGVAANPEMLMRPSFFDSLQVLLKCANLHPNNYLCSAYRTNLPRGIDAALYYRRKA